MIHTVYFKIAYTFAVGVLIGIFLYPSTISHLVVSDEELATYNNVPLETENQTNTQVTLLFTGDIMLGRHVEFLMQREGAQYPFINIQESLNKTDVLIGNFEGSVPPVHKPTPFGTFAFSVKKEYLDVLKNVGFNILSLANNHSFDFKASGFTNTKAECLRVGIVCKGHPSALSEESTHIIEIDGHKIGLLFLHTLYVSPTQEDIEFLLEELIKETDIQIAYVHWGDEYVLVPNASQRGLAHSLIDLGVDAIIGHHPHVIQSVEIYNDAPVFYSLGNFIFDQYFNQNVQEGLLLYVDISSSSVTYRTKAITSIDTPAQPRPASEEATARIKNRIFSSIQNDSRVNTETGVIVISR